jgi:protein SCO1/2|tara:strand:- start:233 stop:877 length:645 start_codon:yes stop_codon:yes gene_type:complete
MIKVLLLLLIVVSGCDKIKKDEFHLPILSPADLDPNWIDSSLKNSKKEHFVPNFSFTNQNGEGITEQNVFGKILAVNYFFTTCPSICPTLTKNMKRVQNAFSNDNDVIILSHSVFPEHDNPEVLKAYAELYGVESDKWHLLTGKKKDIYSMARKGHFAVTGDNSDNVDSFIHTENFIIVDKKSRIRGIYNGVNPHDVNRFIEDIQLLKKESLLF